LYPERNAWKNRVKEKQELRCFRRMLNFAGSTPQGFWILMGPLAYRRPAFSGNSSKLALVIMIHGT
jgi:hypothetical protein